jgi:hypothetical protein
VPVTKPKSVPSEADLSRKVARFLSRETDVLLDGERIKLRCHPVTTELEVDDIKFDAVGFSPEEGTFYLVESKVGTDAKDIGHAFGQILAYKAVIRESGRLFLRRFAKKTRDFPPMHMEAITTRRKIPCRFLVALTEDACAKARLIRWIQKTLKKNEQVGVIQYSVRSKQCRPYISVDGREDYQFFRSSVVWVPYREVFPTTREFLQDAKQRVVTHSRGKMQGGTPWGSVVQFGTGRAPFHYEIQVKKKPKRKKGRPRIEAALDIEPRTGNLRFDRKIKDSFMSFALRKIRGRNVPNLRVEKNWSRHGTWGRICYEIDFDALDSDISEKVAKAIVKLQRIFGPTVRSFEHKGVSPV